MKKHFLFFLLCIIVCSCSNNEDRVKIIAHRGFWNCEEGGFSENSIASLKAAQNAGLWGSECDVQLTADNIVIVNHDPRINGKKIRSHKYSDFSKDLLPNGEIRPTLNDYLTQCRKSSKTRLVIELKSQECDEDEIILVNKTLDAIKAHRLYDPDRVAFISFSRLMCMKIAEYAPEFTNQYLTGDLSPDQLIEKGINGMDYHFMKMRIHSNWIDEALEKGLSTNSWTVDNPDVAEILISRGVQALTTNDPLMIRNLLSDK